MARDDPAAAVRILQAETPKALGIVVTSVPGNA